MATSSKVTRKAGGADLAPQFGVGDCSSSAYNIENIDDPCGQEAARGVLHDVPKGTIMVAGIAVTILFVGWLLTFFLLYLPRGYSG